MWDQIRKHATGAALAVLLAFVSPARAQYGSQYLSNLGSENFNWYMNSIMIRQTASPEAYRRAARAKAARQAAEAPLTAGSTTAGSTTALSTPRRLALGYPPAARAEAEKLFARLLTGYGRIEDQFAIPKGDVAGAVAALVAGSYMALHNTDFPDAHFKVLLVQMREAIGKDDRFAAASPTERRAMFEETAILGMMLATTQMALKTRPNTAVEANMRSAGQKYLRQLTGLNPETLTLGPDGLSAG